MGPDLAARLFVSVLFLAVVLVGVMLVLRHRNQQMLHQERMAALEKGTTVPAEPAPAPWSPRVYLLRGLMWSMGGAALIICLFGLAASSHRPASGESIMWRAKTLSQRLRYSAGPGAPDRGKRRGEPARPHAFERGSIRVDSAGCGSGVPGLLLQRQQGKGHRSANCAELIIRRWRSLTHWRVGCVL